MENLNNEISKVIDPLLRYPQKIYIDHSIKFSKHSRTGAGYSVIKIKLEDFFSEKFS